MEPDDYDYWPAQALKDPEAVLQRMSRMELIIHIERARVYNDLCREGEPEMQQQVEEAYLTLLDRLTGWCSPEAALEEAPEQKDTPLMKLDRGVARLVKEGDKYIIKDI